MLQQLRPALVMIVLFTVITGLIYPFAMTGIAKVVFPNQAAGSLVERDGKVVGSALMGQVFADDKYFQGRPSATSAPDPKDSTKTVDAPYNAANSAGSNLGPDQQGADRARPGRRRQTQAGEPVRAGPDRSRDRVRQRARSAYLPGRGPFPGPPCRQGAQYARRARASAGPGACRGAYPWHLRRAACQRAPPQPRTGSSSQGVAEADLLEHLITDGGSAARR